MYNDYNFNPAEPASCIAQGEGAKGVYKQRGRTWYYNGTLACEIDHLSHLSKEELLRFGEETLRRKYQSSLSF